MYYFLMIVQKKNESIDTKEEVKVIVNGDSGVGEEGLKSKNLSKKRKRKGTGSGNTLT